MSPKKDASNLTREQEIAFSILPFGNVSVGKAILEGDKMLPYNLEKDKEIMNIFAKVRAEYNRWESLKTTDSVFTIQTAALLMQFGIIPEDFLTFLAKKVRFMKYKKEATLLFRRLRHGEFIDGFFNREIENNIDIHSDFLRDIFPKIVEVFSAFKPVIYPDISKAPAKVRLMETLAGLLKNQGEEVFKSWDGDLRNKILQILEEMRAGLQNEEQTTMLIDIADQNLLLATRLPDLDDDESQIDEFMSQFEGENGGASFDAGHGWVEGGSDESWRG